MNTGQDITVALILVVLVVQSPTHLISTETARCFTCQRSTQHPRSSLRTSVIKGVYARVWIVNRLAKVFHWRKNIPLA